MNATVGALATLPNVIVSTKPADRALGSAIGAFALLSENPMSFNRSAFVKWAFSAALAAAALSAAAVANAEVNWSIGTGAPIYYEPAPAYASPPPVYYEPEPPVYYRPPPPVYYQPPPPPVYYRQPPAYYGPPPQAYDDEPDYWRGSPSAGQPKLSRMQQRALDNCVVLAPRDQPRCRATVLSTVR